MKHHFSEASAHELRFELKLTTNLITSERKTMYALMEACYVGMTEEGFASDLTLKDLVILLLDSENQIRGFSTVAYNPKGCGGDEFNMIFSGDTIIDPAYWGSPALSQGFRTVLGGFKGAEKKKPLYWFLISKGYRTYLYLPLYFRQFYPAVVKERQEDLGSVVDTCARILFPTAWQPQTGLIQFTTPKDRLKSEFADTPPEKIRNSHVRFFLERNPGFINGDELVCMAKVETENLLRPDPHFFEKSQALPSSLFREITSSRKTT